MIDFLMPYVWCFDFKEKEITLIFPQELCPIKNLLGKVINVSAFSESENIISFKPDKVLFTSFVIKYSHYLRNKENIIDLEYEPVS